MQANNGEDIADKDRRLANQYNKIRKVIDWLRDEGLEPQDITSLRKDAHYYGVVISKETDKIQQGEKRGREAFHVLFPIDRPDSLTISQVIILDLLSQKAYASLANKTNGILDQNRFYFELEQALLEKNVSFTIKKNRRELKSFEISKVISFDLLTKDMFFDSIKTIRNSIEIVRRKTSELPDSVLSSKESLRDESNILK